MRHLPNKYLNIVFLAFLAFLVFGKNDFLLASDTPPNQWRVKSVYTDPLNQGRQTETQWSYRLESADSGFKVTVTDDNQRMGVSGIMIFNEDSDLVKMIRNGRMGSKSYSLERVFDGEKPAIIEDALVPCNWLNLSAPWDLKAALEYEITEKVSAANRFVTYLRVTGQTMPVADAVAKAMITEDMAASLSTDELTLVTVQKVLPGRSAQTIVTQLWSPGHFFWLFEQTPSRQSYLMRNED